MAIPLLQYYGHRCPLFDPFVKFVEFVAIKKNSDRLVFAVKLPGAYH
jgi:hypothetical protein